MPTPTPTPPGSGRESPNSLEAFDQGLTAEEEEVMAEFAQSHDVMRNPNYEDTGSHAILPGEQYSKRNLAYGQFGEGSDDEEPKYESIERDSPTQSMRSYDHLGRRPHHRGGMVNRNYEVAETAIEMWEVGGSAQQSESVFRPVMIPPKTCCQKSWKYILGGAITGLILTVGAVVYLTAFRNNGSDDKDRNKGIGPTITPTTPGTLTTTTLPVTGLTTTLDSTLPATVTSTLASTTTTIPGTTTTTTTKGTTTTTTTTSTTPLPTTTSTLTTTTTTTTSTSTTTTVTTITTTTTLPTLPPFITFPPLPTPPGGGGGGGRRRRTVGLNENGYKVISQMQKWVEFLMQLYTKMQALPEALIEAIAVGLQDGNIKTLLNYQTAPIAKGVTMSQVHRSGGQDVITIMNAKGNLQNFKQPSSQIKVFHSPYMRFEQIQPKEGLLKNVFNPNHEAQMQSYKKLLFCAGEKIIDFMDELNTKLIAEPTWTNWAKTPLRALGLAQNELDVGEVTSFTGFIQEALGTWFVTEKKALKYHATRLKLNALLIQQKLYKQPAFVSNAVARKVGEFRIKELLDNILIAYVKE